MKKKHTFMHLFESYNTDRHNVVAVVSVLLIALLFLAVGMACVAIATYR